MEPLKLAIFHLMQCHFADIVRCVAFCNIIMKGLNGFPMTQRQVTLKDVCGYLMLKSFIGHVYMSDAFLADIVDRSRLYSNCTTSALVSAMHDQLASLDRHAQLTRCFSAVAELVVILSPYS